MRAKVIPRNVPRRAVEQWRGGCGAAVIHVAQLPNPRRDPLRQIYMRISVALQLFLCSSPPTVLLALSVIETYCKDTHRRFPSSWKLTRDILSTLKSGLIRYSDSQGRATRTSRRNVLRQGSSAVGEVFGRGAQYCVRRAFCSFLSFTICGMTCYLRYGFRQDPQTSATSRWIST